MTEDYEEHAFLRELLVALDAMPVPRLIRGQLRRGGWVCALGAVGERRGMNLEEINSTGRRIAEAFGISEALATEIVHVNDDGVWKVETPEQRWERVRAWVVSEIDTTGGSRNAV